MVLIHGGFCDRRDWSAQIQALSARFRVIAVDLPGHGESGLPATADIATFAQIVWKLVARHGSGSVVLAGHSLGCRVALEMFRQSPSGIIGLILAEGSIVTFGDAASLINAFEEKLNSGGVFAFMRPLLEDMFGEQSDSAFVRHAIERVRRVNNVFGKEILLNTMRWDADEAAQTLAKVTMPMLVLDSTYLDEKMQRHSLISGTKTPWMELVTARVPGAGLCVVPGVGHFLMVEAAEAVSRHISTFVENCGKAHLVTSAAES